MNISVAIPQVFYDLISRVLPGLFFLTLVQLSTSHFASYISLTHIDTDKTFGDSIGIGVQFLVLCYFLGWFFHGVSLVRKDYTNQKKHKEQKISGTSNAKNYQWIRLAHPAAGFRIVKLRAEARMLEATRTALCIFAILIIVDFFLSTYTHTFPSTTTTNTTTLACSLLFTLSFAYISYFHLEKKAWKNYNGNIGCIYRLLHDKKNPIPNYRGPEYSVKANPRLRGVVGGKDDHISGLK